MDAAISYLGLFSKASHKVRYFLLLILNAYYYSCSNSQPQAVEGSLSLVLRYVRCYFIAFFLYMGVLFKHPRVLAFFVVFGLNSNDVQYACVN